MQTERIFWRNLRAVALAALIAASAGWMAGCSKSGADGKEASDVTPFPSERTRNEELADASLKQIGGLAPAPIEAPAMEMADNRVKWRDWSDEAFAEAKKRDVPVLLNITAKWCYACLVMERVTYNDENVAGEIEANFVSIRVNGEARPDIQDRYSMGGWPTTAFLTPEAEIIAGFGLLKPDQLMDLMKKASADYAERRSEILATVEKNKARRAAEASYEKTDPDDLDLSFHRKAVAEALKQFDPEFGGFGVAPKFPNFPATDLILLEFARTDSEDCRSMIEKTAAAMAQMADPEFGGFWHYAEDRDWGKPHHEKLLGYNASYIQSLIGAYRAVKDPAYLEAIKNGLDYVDAFLSDSQNGGFYGGQHSALFEPETGEILEGDKYYALTAAERKEKGFPAVDRSLYAAANARMISAYFAAAALFDNPRYAEFGMKSLERLRRDAYKNGALFHAIDAATGAASAPDLLEDRIALLDAALSAYEYSGKTDLLAFAVDFARETIARLGDAANGGFYYSAPAPNALGELQSREKPAAANAEMAWLLTKLSLIAGPEPFKSESKRAIAVAVAAAESSDSLRDRADVAVNLFRTIRFPVEFTIVGPKGDPATRTLMDITLDFADPRKVIQTLDPKADAARLEQTGYVERDKPSIYACVDEACSMPIDDPAKFEQRLTPFLNRFLKEGPEGERSGAAPSTENSIRKAALPASELCPTGEISPERLKALLDDKDGLGAFSLVDVREPEVHAAAHIAGDSLIPLGQVQQDFPQRFEKDETLILYCRSGRRSGIARGQLQELGYKNVCNLKGGMLEWNYPVEQGR